MRRSALALLGLLALPAAAAAQDRPLLANEPPPERLPESRFSITPYLGIRVPFNASDQLIILEDGEQVQLESQRGGSMLVGVNADVRLRGPWSLTFGGAYSGAEQDEISVLAIGDSAAVQFEVDGPAMWFAKAGVSVRLPDPIPDNRRFHPSAFITVAPTLVWLQYDQLDGAPDGFDDSSMHFALNIAAEAVTRFGRSSNWALSLGFEDYLAFWNTDEFRARDQVIGELITGEPVLIDYDSGASNVLALRLGVSYRFR